MSSAGFTLSVFALILPAQSNISARLERSMPFGADFSNRPLPRFQNGVLAGTDSTRTRVTLWSADGRSLLDVPLNIPGAAKTIVADVAVSGTGEIAAGVSNISHLGQVGPAIAWLDARGAIQRVVAVPSFGIRRLVFAADGTLWALGREFDSNLRDVPDYSLLRHYDAQGRLLGSALPRSLFPQGQVDPANTSYLITDGDRLIVVSITAARWADVSSTRRVKTISSWDTSTFPGEGFVTGIAAANGELFATAQNQDLGELYRYNGTQKGWTLVSTKEVRSLKQGLVLLGSDGGRVVIRTKPQGALAWVAVQ
jgi:hypothetical protein